MDFETYKKKRAELQAQMAQTLRDNGKSILKEVFEPLLTSGKIKMIRWRQYTPYYNDGEACVFGVEDPTVLPYWDFAKTIPGFFANLVEYEEELTAENLTEEEMVELFEDNETELFSSVWGAFMDTPFQAELENFTDKFRDIQDILEDSFGDHALVTAELNSEGEVVFTSERYIHH